MSQRGLATSLVTILTLACSWTVVGQTTPEPEPAIPPGGDVPEAFEAARESFDFERREAMVPMRDGVRLYTVILVPRGREGEAMPILLTRTPYGADRASSGNDSPRLRSVLGSGDDIVAVSGYIRVFQDIRGRFESEGDYVLTRPLRGPLNHSEVDHATDTWDTIDWLVKEVPESNGRVGMIGTSYGGYLALMGLVDPHPALRAAVPINPLVDGWIGDDWFHYGAFRQATMLYVYNQTASKNRAVDWWTGYHDDYTRFLEAGSAGAMGRSMGMQQLPFWRRLTQHPAYDDYWRQHAVDRILAGRPVEVPTLHVHGYWDQEDIYGAIGSYTAMEPQDEGNDRNFLVIGPWRHGGSNSDGRSLGALRFDSDTGREFRRDILQPFLDHHLKGARDAAIEPVTVYETGTSRWRHYDAWPRSCDDGCPWQPQRLYLRPDFSLGLSPVAAGDGDEPYDAYVSDPAKPVPYRIRPIRPIWAEDSTWREWLVDDQRFASSRTDVLVYVSDVLEEPVKIAGRPVANLFASTTGSDADWVVKLIDVYPPEVPEQRELGGYQLGVAMDIFRGRYRNDLGRPQPIPPDEVEQYRFALPTAHHVFRPGHRIMVQIQSSWFPLYDRNPQTYVDNIFFAEPEDYRKATHRVYRDGETASYVELPVVGANADGSRAGGQ